MVAIIAVLEFPPKLSFKSLKTYNSFLKLYIHFLVTRITFLVRVKKTYNYMYIIVYYGKTSYIVHGVGKITSLH